LSQAPHHGHLRFGWCIVVQLLVKVDHQWRHEHVFVAQPNGQYVSANRDWQIATGDLDDWSDASEQMLTHLGEYDCANDPSLAVVAAKGVDRTLFWPLFHRLTPGWTIDSLGGNPIITGFALGDLCASMTLRTSTTWDTCWIPVAASLGAVVSNLEGEIVPLMTLRDWWSFIGVGEASLVIPPLLVTRPEFHDELVDQRARSRLLRWTNRSK